MNTQHIVTQDSLKIDAEAAVSQITQRIQHILGRRLKRRGLVVALSGGIDSSVTTALCARAIGRERVVALLMPERQSATETLPLSEAVAAFLGVPKIFENITPMLAAARFYERYAEAVRRIIPEYGEGWKSKIVISNVLEKKGYNLFSIVAESPDGERIKKRLPLKAYLEMVAATNFKQRIRKMLEYYHADRLNFAVAGTPNRLEYDQGFFVKLGDGAADLKPIAHLYKTQVYLLAEFLGIPPDIRNRPPTTDTYSLPQGQDEFYFSLPYDKMDLCLFAKNNGLGAQSVAPAVGLNAEQIERIFEDIDNKRATTRYLHMEAQLVEQISEINMA